MKDDETTDHPELSEFEGETLGDTITNLITEIQRVQDNFQKYEFECDRMMKIIETVDDFVRREEAYKLTYSKWQEILEAF
tara:strand:+ start:84 stop:323 length:240 start_codon:yes stop_codon:yes gene_type:complete